MGEARAGDEGGLRWAVVERMGCQRVLRERVVESLVGESNKADRDWSLELVSIFREVL